MFFFFLLFCAQPYCAIQSACAFRIGIQTRVRNCSFYENWLILIFIWELSWHWFNEFLIFRLYFTSKSETLMKWHSFHFDFQFQFIFTLEQAHISTNQVCLTSVYNFYSIFAKISLNLRVLKKRERNEKDNEKGN